jgi:urease beta subunit
VTGDRVIAVGKERSAMPVCKLCNEHRDEAEGRRISRGELASLRPRPGDEEAAILVSVHYAASAVLPGDLELPSWLCSRCLSQRFVTPKRWWQFWL